MADSKAVVTPGISENDRSGEHELSPGMNPTLFRRTVAKLNYVAVDRPDVAFAVHRLTMKMAAPAEEDWLPLKRLLRYLKGVPRMSLSFPWQPAQDKLNIMTDSDWAGCKDTRKSTSGGVIRYGKHVIK